MRRRISYANVTATLALVLALTAPVWAAPVAQTAASPSKKALKLAKKADKRSKQALTAANKALARSPQNGAAGQAGPQGAKGDQGAAGTQGPQGATGPSTGAAGGDLTGNFPSPLIGAEKVTPDKIGTTPTVGVTQFTSQEGDSQDLNFGIEMFDVSQMHSAGGDNTKIVAPIDGIYQVTARVRWTPDGLGNRTITVMKNGSDFVAQDFEELTSAVQVENQISTPMKLVAGDFLQLSATETSAGDPDVAGCGPANGDLCLHFGMYWVGPR